jgi:FHA domain-containing protein
MVAPPVPPGGRGSPSEMDQSKKTMRHFYCRDVLWETFEQMANDFDCSIDYLINEAMRYYARSKNYHSAQATGGEFRSSTGPVGAPGTNPPVSRGDSVTNPPSSGNIRRTQPPPPPASARPSMSQPAQNYAPATPPSGVPAVPRRQPAPAPRSTPMPQDAVSPGGTLFLVFNSQKIAIEKDQFIIGRGSKTSDLAIKDGNISRKHAAVIRRNGTYYIKDLGSTNGIDYKGMRIDNKRIDEGDVFHLCDYELRFTYR